MVSELYQILCAVVSLVYFAKSIYPDRFADIDPDAVRREYAQESSTISLFRTCLFTVCPVRSPVFLSIS